MTKFVDTHTHVDHILDKFKLSLDAFPAFIKENFPPELEKCISVCCEIESFEATEKIVGFDFVYAGMENLFSLCEKCKLTFFSLK